jgi:hypothetical protein
MGFKLKSNIRLTGMLISQIFCITVIVSCGGGGSSSPISSQTINVVSISGVGGTTTVNRSGLTDLDLSGTNNTVNVETDIRNIDISGVNNLINFADGVEVENCEISGSDNSAIAAGELTINCSDSGVGNSGF